MSAHVIGMTACFLTAGLCFQVAKSPQAPDARILGGRILIGVRFKSGEIPCTNKADSVHSSMAKRQLCPDWGIVDQNGEIIGSGYEVVISFPGEVAWGFVNRGHLNENGRCIKDITEAGPQYQPCLKMETDAFGWALLDSQARVLLSAHQFGKQDETPLISDVGLFSEGLAAADFGSIGSDRWGFVDLFGNTVIRGQYDEAGPFCEGLAPVRFQPKTEMSGTSMHITLGNYTFIDRRGNEIGKDYVDVKSFAEGLAPVREKDAWGYIDRKGQTVIPAAFADADPFFEGLAATRIGGDVFDDADLEPDFRGSWGYIDKIGHVTVRHQYLEAERFSQGLAFVCREQSGKKVCGAIDRDGAEKIKFEYSRASYFREGLAPICKEIDGKNSCGAIDPAGNVKVPFVYLSLTHFRDGIAIARNPSGKFLFVDSAGHPVGESATIGFDDVRIFRSGLAAVKRGGLWGFIDRAGRLVVTPRYVDVAPDWKYAQWGCPTFVMRPLRGEFFRNLVNDKSN